MTAHSKICCSQSSNNGLAESNWLIAKKKHNKLPSYISVKTLLDNIKQYQLLTYSLSNDEFKFVSIESISEFKYNVRATLGFLGNNYIFTESQEVLTTYGFKPIKNCRAHLVVGRFGNIEINNIDFTFDYQKTYYKITLVKADNYCMSNGVVVKC